MSPKLKQRTPRPRVAARVEGGVEMILGRTARDEFARAQNDSMKQGTYRCRSELQALLSFDACRPQQHKRLNL